MTEIENFNTGIKNDDAEIINLNPKINIEIKKIRILLKNIAESILENIKQ